MKESRRDISHIYEEVKGWVARYYGTSQWCYTDYFCDEAGFEYFADSLATDQEISAEMSDDEVIDYIEGKLGKNMTMYEFQQSMLSMRR